MRQRQQIPGSQNIKRAADDTAAQKREYAAACDSLETAAAADLIWETARRGSRSIIMSVYAGNGCSRKPRQLDKGKQRQQIRQSIKPLQIISYKKEYANK